jgi:hypothetical protein
VLCALGCSSSFCSFTGLAAAFCTGFFFFRTTTTFFFSGFFSVWPDCEAAAGFLCLMSVAFGFS